MIVPKIKSVKPVNGNSLLIMFVNGVQKRYDCHKLLKLDRFQLLKHKAFVNTVTVEPGGYGVAWNDEMDLSEYELWTNGVEVEQSTDQREEGSKAPQLARG